MVIQQKKEKNILHNKTLKRIAKHDSKKIIQHTNLKIILRICTNKSYHTTKVAIPKNLKNSQS